MNSCLLNTLVIEKMFSFHYAFLMNKSLKLLLFPLSLLTLVSCGTETSSSSSSSSSSNILGGQTLNDVLDYFDQSLSANASYKYFEGSKTPGATTIFTEKGCFTTYRNFTNLTSNGLITIDSTLASSKGVEAGVYQWTKDSETKALTLGDKVGEGTYQEVFHNPKEIKENKSSYIHNLRYETECEKTDSKAEVKFTDAEKAAKNGNFTLNKIFKDEESEKLLINFAKSLGVYEIIDKTEGMELNYANIYFGPITASLSVTFYSQYKGGYSSFETTVTVNQFGTAKINELTSYIGA